MMLLRMIKKLLKKMICLFPFLNRIYLTIDQSQINRIFQEQDINKINPLPVSYPSHITLSLSNVCNMSCQICAINNFKSSGIKRVKNNISFNQIRAFSPLLKRVSHISFMGLIGESVLNPNFNRIVKYLKSHYKTSLFVSTNGMGVTPEMSRTMIDVGFDAINFSIHAVTDHTYRQLQGGKLVAVQNNLLDLLNKKQTLQKDKPHITVVYALNEKNIAETTKMVDFVKKNTIDALFLYHYRDYGFNDIALDKDVTSANQAIDQIYVYAREQNALSLLPDKKPYYKKYPSVNDSDLDQSDLQRAECRCELPWSGLQMRSCYSHQDSYYLGCCNVFNVFLFNYKEHLQHYGKLQMKKIWHHPVFQYLRETVNTSPRGERNPLCRYCKSSKRDYYKNTDNLKNYRIKLKMIEQFFQGFRARFNHEPSIAGLKILYTEDNELRKMANYND